MSADPFAGAYIDEVEEVEDPFAGAYIDEEEEIEIAPKKRKLSSQYEVEEKTADDLKKMSTRERYEYALDIKRQREFLLGKGFTKGALSGLTLGATEKEPGLGKSFLLGAAGQFLPSLKKDEEDLGFGAGEFTGSVLPVDKLFKLFGPLAKLAQKSPILARPLTALAGLTGATYEGLKEGISGKFPSLDDLTTHGAEWAALDAALSTLGAGGRFAKSLLTKAKSLNQPTHEVLNDLINQMRSEGVDFTVPERVSEKALSILEKPLPKANRELSVSKEEPVSPTQQFAKERFDQIQEQAADLKNKKVEPQKWDRLEEKLIPLETKPPLEERDFKQASQDLERDNISENIDALYPERKTELALGEEIQENLQTTFEEAKDIYTPLYQEAEEASQFINIQPTTVTKRASEILQRLERLKTKPAGYQNVINTLENIFEDLGFAIERDSKGKFFSAHGPSEGISADNLIELGRRVNEVVDYDVLDPSVRDRLKPVVNAIKKDIKQALAQTPEALNAFEAAEQLYGSTAELFDADPIRRIRKSEQPEKVLSDITSPSTFRKLKEILPTQRMEGIEREVLENMRDASYGEARRMFRELKPHFSFEAEQVGQNIVNSKAPLGTAAKTKSFQNAILNDLSNAMTTGDRPKQVLGLWRTSEGQKLIKDVLKNTPNRDKTIDYLKNQTFYDFVSKFMEKDGMIDVPEFKKMIKNKDFKRNLRDLGGQNAVEFFNTIEKRLGSFERNLSVLDKLPPKLDSKRGNSLIQKAKEKAEAVQKPSKFVEEALGITAPEKKLDKKVSSEWGKERLKKMAAKDFPLQAKLNAFLDYLGIEGKTALSVFGLLKFGIPGATKAYIGYKLLHRLATNPKFRKVFKDATRKHTDFTQLINAWTKLEKELDDSA